MQAVITLTQRANRSLLGLLRPFEWLGPLVLRLYLAPVFWVAGMNKVSGFGNVVDWFGNSDWGLGLPVPWLMAALATAAEIGGAVLLLLGLATRWVTLPLIVTMLVAISAVHWENGWQAVHDPSSPFASEFTFSLEGADAEAAGTRLERARGILREHGNYDWLTEKGSFVVLNSGIEFAATYLAMLLALLFAGGGAASLDRLLERTIAGRRRE